MSELVGKPTVTGTMHGITCSECVQLRAEREASIAEVNRLGEDLAAARAEVERLKKLQEGARLLTLQQDDALARVRGALASEVEKILALANGLSTSLKGTPSMYEANKIMHAAWAIQAALEAGDE